MEKIKAENEESASQMFGNLGGAGDGDELSEYWRQREEEQRKRNITDEAKYDKVVDRMYRESLADIQKEIDAFYGRYANKEGISITDAKKRVDKLDIEAYERLAKRVVADKDFSPEANQAMRLYNLTMKVNRLEMLKSMIGVHLASLSDSLDKYTPRNSIATLLPK